MSDSASILTGSGSAEYVALRAELNEKPGTWKLLGLFLTAMAVPFAVMVGIIVVWVPREVDSLKALAVEARDTSKLAETASKLAADAAGKAEAGSLDTVRSMDLLTIAIARSDAKGEGRLHDGAQYVAENVNAVKRLLPSDLFLALMRSEKLSGFSFSDFMDQTWIFVDRPDFNKLSISEQRDVRASFEHVQVKFYVE